MKCTHAHVYSISAVLLSWRHRVVSSEPLLVIYMRCGLTTHWATYEVLIGHCLSTRQDLCVLTQVMLSVCPQYDSECNTWFMPSAYRMLSTDYYRSYQHFITVGPKYIHFYNITSSDTGIVLVSVMFYQTNRNSEATCVFIDVIIFSVCVWFSL